MARRKEHHQVFSFEGTHRSAPEPAPAKTLRTAADLDSRFGELMTPDPVPVFPAAVPAVTDPIVSVEPKPASHPQSNAQKMDQMALVFLDDPIARRLAVAWISCGGNETTWYDCAGMQKSGDAQRVGKALRINGICRDGGVTDQMAIAYINAIVAKPLKSVVRKEQK